LTPRTYIPEEHSASILTPIVETEALGFSKLLVSIYKSTGCPRPEDNSMYFYHCNSLSLAVKTVLHNHHW